MSSLGVIVARGASKRLPRKVIRPLLGTPLLAWVGRAALASRLDRVVLSTEDDEVAAVAEQFGLDVPFLRPMELAQDFIGNEKVVVHALDKLQANEGAAFDIVVLIQATAPFTLPEHIDACVEELISSDGGCCFTVRPVREPPQWMFRRGEGGEVSLLLDGDLSGERQHTQTLEPYFVPSGAVWAVRAQTLRETLRFYTAPFRMVEIDPRRAADIDEEIDLVVAEAFAREYGFQLVGEEAGRSLQHGRKGASPPP